MAKISALVCVFGLVGVQFAYNFCGPDSPITHFCEGCFGFGAIGAVVFLLMGWNGGGVSKKDLLLLQQKEWEYQQQMQQMANNHEQNLLQMAESSNRAITEQSKTIQAQTHALEQSNQHLHKALVANNRDRQDERQRFYADRQQERQAAIQLNVRLLAQLDNRDKQTMQAYYQLGYQVVELAGRFMLQTPKGQVLDPTVKQMRRADIEYLRGLNSGQIIEGKYRELPSGK